MVKIPNKLFYMLHLSLLFFLPHFSSRPFPYPFGPSCSPCFQYLPLCSLRHFRFVVRSLCHQSENACLLVA
ncbi:hypothetical protein BKA57DRAFT_123582 [Linnemannia elongata]|nr:hypothetical protein BKA57DRAFT_123582 [Linnemannia elongata]